MMGYGNFLGVDPGLTVDPTATVLLRATCPLVVIRDGRVLDAASGQPVELPGGVTVAEFVLPKYEVLDVQSRKGVTFPQVAREGRAIFDDLGGDLLVAVDSTGMGIGCSDALRQAGVPTVACTLTGGTKVTGGRWRLNVPTGILFSTLYACLAQQRLKVSAAAGGKLIEELKGVERRVTEQGHESYEVPRGGDGHGDTVFALGLAVVVAERVGGRLARLAALHPGGHQRKPGRLRRGGAAKAVIKARLEESRARAERDMYRQIGQHDDPFFE